MFQVRHVLCQCLDLVFYGNSCSISSLAILSPVYRIAMELYEAVSRRMGIPEVVIRIFMGYMRQFRIFVVTFLGVLDPIQRTISTPQV